MAERMPPGDQRIPLVDERLRVGTEQVVTGRVRIKTLVDDREVWVRGDLERRDVEVERISIDQLVDVAPEVRRQGDLLIIPVVEEVIVAEKRLLLKEELHIRTVTRTEPVEQAVHLRSTRAVVERDGVPENPTSTDDPLNRPRARNL